MNKTNTSKNTQDRWLLPEAEGWTLGPLESTTRVGVADPAKARADGLVWPLQSLIGLPLWLAGQDASTFAGAASLQLEKLGLGPRTYHEDSLRVREIARDGERTLVLALALNRQVKDGEVNLLAKNHVAILDVLDWPANRVVLFREAGHWGVVVTRGSEPVYFSIFAGTHLPAHAASDLACVAESLRRQGVISTLGGVTLWDAAGADAEKALRDGLGLPVVLGARPPWRAVAGISARGLVHPAIARQRARQGRARQVRQLAAVLGLVLVGILGVSGGRVLWAMKDLQSLEGEYASLRAESQGIREVARRWRQLESTLEPAFFPLEHLRAVSVLLPPNGVRLTEFQWKDGQLRLTGEASDTTMAFAYAEGLHGYDQFSWEMDPPNIQPNNSAQFVVKGRGAR